MHYILIVPLFLLLSCSDSPTQKPHLIDINQKLKSSTQIEKSITNDVKIATIEAQTKKELAQIEREKALGIETIKKEIETQKIETQKEIALQDQEINTKKILQEQEMINRFTFVGLFIFLATLLTFIYFLRKQREDKLKIHEDELQLKEKELQVKVAEKMLETLASGNLTANEEQRILEMFEKNSTPQITK